MIFGLQFTDGITVKVTVSVINEKNIVSRIEFEYRSSYGENCKNRKRAFESRFSRTSHFTHCSARVLGTSYATNVVRYAT